MDAHEIVAKQRRYFIERETFPEEFRRQQLLKLKNLIIKNEQNIIDALKQDLGKAPFESFGGEIGLLLGEIRHALKHLGSWMKPKRAPTPRALFPSKSWIHCEPRGVTLIIAPWNYPIQLLLTPLIGAISAGNCAVLKPSEIAVASSALVASMIQSEFPPDYIAVCEGGPEVTTRLVAQSFDYIFFTGGIFAGRTVAEAASKRLIPYSLELGGKSPCVIDENTDIRVTSKRLTWGKFYNAGQNCVSPDYVLVPRSISKQLIQEIRGNLNAFFGGDASSSPDFGRIINERHFLRISGLIDPSKVVIGGKIDKEKLYIEPTVLYPASMEDEAMKEEIFGPILPVLEYDTIAELLELLRQRPNPLSFYIFSRNRKFQKKILESVPFGGGCINDTLVHLFNPNLPFGGIGESGIGAYHGKFSFETFSHVKGIVKSTQAIDVPLRYPPYANKLAWLKKIVRG